LAKGGCAIGRMIRSPGEVAAMWAWIMFAVLVIPVIALGVWASSRDKKTRRAPRSNIRFK
jgi:hypothetical protein